MNRKIFNIALFVLISVTAIFPSCRESNSKTENKRMDMESIQNDNLEKATFGSGCFWCTEAIFERVEGVKSIVSGYAGGIKENPSYEEVCTGSTGHAEAVQVSYDPNVISYDEILKIFWQTHDPTTLNRQGGDVGTQYRSVVFYHNNEQKEKAEGYKKELNKSGAWKDPIVTQIVPFTKFYKAEDYHQNYFANNPEKGYCAFVIAPKVEKFEKVFKDKLKK